MASNPDLAAQFAGAMKTQESSSLYDHSHIVDGYDWASIGEGLVVDVGGSRGHIAVPLAQKHSNIRLLVQDMAHVVEGASTNVPADLSGRVTFMDHDIFTEQPVVADVYFLRWILHNWPQKYAIQILKNLIPSLKPGARIIVQEKCMPEPGEISLRKEQVMRYA